METDDGDGGPRPMPEIDAPDIEGEDRKGGCVCVSVCLPA